MKKNTNPVRIAALTAVILAVLVLAVITAKKLSDFRAQTEPGRDPETINAATELTRTALEDEALLYKGVRYVPRRGIESYLILGVDRTEAQIASGLENGQADVLLLLVLDPREDRYRTLQLNRETVTQVNILAQDGSTAASLFKPVCLAHAYAGSPEAGCENTVSAVRYLLQDVPIDGYAAMNLESIGVLCDAVGGVTVKIGSDLTGIDPAFSEGAAVRLDAETAERFVRARMSLGEDNNLNRMGRQLQFMQAWLDTARRKAQQDTGFAMRLLDRLDPALTTDITEKRLSGIASDAGKYENGGFLTIDGEYRTVDGFQYYYADEESLMETVLELFYQAEQ